MTRPLCATTDGGIVAWVRPVLEQGRLHARCRVFFDKVVDVPFVLSDEVPQMQFIEGSDVPVVLRGQRSAPHLAD